MLKRVLNRQLIYQVLMLMSVVMLIFYVFMIKPLIKEMSIQRNKEQILQDRFQIVSISHHSRKVNSQEIINVIMDFAERSQVKIDALHLMKSENASVVPMKSVYLSIQGKFTEWMTFFNLLNHFTNGLIIDSVNIHVENNHAINFKAKITLVSDVTISTQLTLPSTETIRNPFISSDLQSVFVMTDEMPNANVISIYQLHYVGCLFQNEISRAFFKLPSNEIIVMSLHSKIGLEQAMLLNIYKDQVELQVGDHVIQLRAD